MNDWYYKNKIPGPGSGAKKVEDGGRFIHGLSVFRRWAKERLQELNYLCERCKCEIDTTVRGTWAGHHKDHDRAHNVKDNLEVLCKRCHQVEHECWKAFDASD